MKYGYAITVAAVFNLESGQAHYPVTRMGVVDIADTVDEQQPDAAYIEALAQAIDEWYIRESTGRWQELYGPVKDFVALAISVNPSVPTGPRDV